MKHNKKFIYPKCQREIINGKRHYDIKSEKLPSVTTILSATQSAEKTASLDAWRFRLKDSFIKIPDDTDPSGFTLINEADYIPKKLRIAERRCIKYLKNIYTNYLCFLFNLSYVYFSKRSFSMIRVVPSVHTSVRKG